MTELFENYLQREIDALKASQVGVPIVRKFPFAFNTPGILTGATIYTPTIGDVVIDAWFSIVLNWDGTNPYGDFGSFLGGGIGIFGADNAPINMTQADDSTGYGTGWLPSHHINSLPGAGSQGSPGTITTIDPIKVCVSQNGQPGGADPGSTQGTAVLYLVTATPV